MLRLSPVTRFVARDRTLWRKCVRNQTCMPMSIPLSPSAKKNGWFARRHTRFLHALDEQRYDHIRIVLVLRELGTACLRLILHVDALPSFLRVRYVGLVALNYTKSIVVLLGRSFSFLNPMGLDVDLVYDVLPARSPAREGLW